jgi:hypothetical protein
MVPVAVVVVVYVSVGTDDDRRAIIPRRVIHGSDTECVAHPHEIGE